MTSVDGRGDAAAAYLPTAYPAAFLRFRMISQSASIPPPRCSPGVSLGHTAPRSGTNSDLTKRSSWHEWYISADDVCMLRAPMYANSLKSVLPTS